MSTYDDFEHELERVLVQAKLGALELIEMGAVPHPVMVTLGVDEVNHQLIPGVARTGPYKGIPSDPDAFLNLLVEALGSRIARINRVNHDDDEAAS